MLPRGLAPLLVFVASGAVLVLEILGVRLLAPYVGLTLETYTTIIGVVLAGIAIGAAAGGRAADRVPARPLLALLLAGGGLLALLTVPLVRVLGEAFEGAGTASAMALALFALLPPATVLSAVTPVVVKLELGDLAASGTVVGRPVGWATAGALAGTFATGFVLVPLLPVRATVIGIGALLVLAGLAVGLLFRALPGGTALAVAGAAALLAAVAAVSGSRCQTESVYFCANVVADPDRPAGRTLMLDDLRHSYVDLRDPRHLEFAYTRWMGDAIDAHAPARRAARRGLRRRRRIHAPALPRRHAAGLALARARGRPAARRPRARRARAADRARTCGSRSATRGSRCAASRAAPPTSSSATRSAGARFRGTWRRASSPPTSGASCARTGSTCST